MSRTVSLRLAAVARGLWRALDFTRRAVLNLLLLALLAGVAWWLFNRGPAALEEKTALVLAPSGALLDQRPSTSPRATALGALRGSSQGATRLRDWVAALDAAARDDKIAHAVLLLEDLGGAGLPTLREAAAAIERFKASGKKVYAWGGEYDQRQYYLAAHASELWLHPLGYTVPEGYGRYRTYYKEAFDRFGIAPNVVRVGKFKNAAETFAASGPSAESLESEGAIWGSLWGSWMAGVEKARRLPAGSITRYVDGLPQTLVAAGGNMARLALDSKLVDGLKTQDEFEALMIERGAKDDETRRFRQVSLDTYLQHLKPRTDGDAVGVIVAQGEIGDGKAPAGRIGGLSTAELVKKAREDDKIKALVLRVNSPGGSAYGSELVRRELELTRKAGKPVVVSMGDLAASGGYWISMAADEIIADEATITGSIGVVGLLPSAKGALDKLGVRTGGLSTTWLGDAFDIRRDPDPRLVTLVQSAMGHIYRDFLRLAATQRKTTPEKIDENGQGRAVSGKDALARGLVDRLGGFDDAVKSAATLAKLGDKPRLTWLEVEPGRLQRWMQRFGASVGLDAPMQAALPTLAAGALGVPPAVAADALHDIAWLADVAERRQPFAAVVHCLCGAP